MSCITEYLGINVYSEQNLISWCQNFRNDIALWVIWCQNYHSTNLIILGGFFFDKCACKYLKYTTYIKCILTVTYFYTTRYNIWIFIAKHKYIQTWFVIIAMIVQIYVNPQQPTSLFESLYIYVDLKPQMRQMSKNYIKQIILQ